MGNKYKEFWILKRFGSRDIVFDRKVSQFLDKETVHVIQIEALKEANEKISELKEEIRFLQTKLVGY